MWIFGLFLAAVVGLILWGFLKARRVCVVERQMPARLSSPVTVVHWTDLHVGWGMPFTSKRARDSVRRVVKTLSTNAVCSIFTGDLVNHLTRIPRFEKVLKEFKNMPGAKFFVLGNHDVWHVRMEEVVRALERNGFLQLGKNPIVYEGLQLQGTADILTQRELVTREVLREFEKNPEQPVRILATHNLDALPETVLQKLKNTLVLAGHTHGVVFIERVYYRLLQKMSFGVLGKFDYRSSLWTGYKAVGQNSIASVSNGVGMHTIPMRFGADAQVVMWKIEKSILESVHEI